MRTSNSYIPVPSAQKEPHATEEIVYRGIKSNNIKIPLHHCNIRVQI